jgi:hypothetical protein
MESVGSQVLRFLFLPLMAGMLSAASPDPQEIIQRSVAVMKSDWEQAPGYSYLEHDVESKRHSPPTTKSFKVLMLDGSPYNLATSIGNRALSPAEQAEEQRKLQGEIEKRRQESSRERDKRVARFNRENAREHDLLTAMVDAFQFQLTGDAVVDGHLCWVLDAQPKPDYQPSGHEQRVLKGMQGRLWIDQRTYQWAKVHAEVVRPVTFFGFFAKVGPGTEFDLEQVPVTDNLWLAKRFSMRVKASALGFNEDSTENDTYRDYQPMPGSSAVLRSTK